MSSIKSTSQKEHQLGKRNKDRLLLLEQQLQSMAQMEALLKWSLCRCQAVLLANNQMTEQEDLEKFESLTVNFARFNDILLQEKFRLIDSIELDTGTSETESTVQEKGFD